MPFLALHNPKRKKKARRSAAQKRALRKMLAARKASLAPKRRKARKARRSTRKVSAVKTNTTMKRRSRKSSPRRVTARRSKSRRSTSSRRRRSTGGSPLNQLKASFSKDKLTLVGGVLLGNFATNYLLKMDVAQKLPMVNDKFGRAAYQALIPAAVAIAVRKKNRTLAEGMVIGGIVNAAVTLLQSQSSSLPPIAANLLPPSSSGVSGFKSLPIAFSGFKSVKAYPNGKSLPAAPRSVNGVYDSPVPFVTDAFAKR